MRVDRVDKVDAADRGDRRDIWLVKSGARVIGPLTTEQVAAGIREKEIVLIDELAAPMGRWRLVRDEPRFQAVVEEVRLGQINLREDTEIQAHSDSGFTQTPTPITVSDSREKSAADVSVEIVLRGGETRGDVRQEAALGISTIESARAVNAEFEDEGRHRVSIAPKWQKDGVRKYGISTSGGKSAAGRGMLNKLVWFTSGLALAFAGIYALNQKVRHDGEPAAVGSSRAVSFDSMVHEADFAWGVGRFSAALKLYRRANQMRAGQPRVIARLAALMVQLEGETVAAKRLLSESAVPPSKELRAEFETVLGLAEIAGDDPAAAEGHFMSAQSLAPDSFAAVVNLGTSFFLRKEYTEALRYYASAGDQPSPLMLSAQALIYRDSSNTSASRRPAEVAIQKILRAEKDFVQEALVIDSWLKLANGNRKIALSQARLALDIDPDLTADHRHDPMIYLDPVKWRALLPMCRGIARDLKFSTTKALLALCLFKGGDREEASAVLREGISHDPGNALLRAVDSYVLFNTGRLEDARAAMKMATRTEMPRLALLMQMRICASMGDLVCAKNSAGKLLTQENPPLAAMAELADILLNKELQSAKSSTQQRSDRERAAELVGRAQKISPTYRPVIELKAKLEER